jgi:hypothetical protein
MARSSGTPATPGVSDKVQWDPHDNLETSYRLAGIKFEHVDVKISEVDVTASENRQTRLDEKDERGYDLERAGSLAELIKQALTIQGGKRIRLNHLVVFRLPNGKYVIFDGMHRLGALNIVGETWFRAILITSEDPASQDLAAVTPNLMEGIGNTPEQSMQKALRFCEQHPEDTREPKLLAEIFRVKGVEKFVTRVNVLRARRQMSDSRSPAYVPNHLERLDVAALEPILPLLKINQVVFAAFARELAALPGVPPKEHVHQVYMAVKKNNGGDAGQISLMKQKVAELAPLARPREEGSAKPASRHLPMNVALVAAIKGLSTTVDKHLKHPGPIKKLFKQNPPTVQHFRTEFAKLVRLLKEFGNELP